MASKFSKPKPIGSSTLWQLRQVASDCAARSVGARSGPSRPVLLLFEFRHVGRWRRDAFAQHLFQHPDPALRTGLVRLGNDVAASVAGMPRMPPRLGLVSLTRRILGPCTDCFSPYNLANGSFRNV